jgi:hypothetical protein
MNKYAIVKDGIVINVIEYAEQPTTPPPGFDEGHIAIQADHVSPNWHYSNGTFTNPNPPVVVAMPAPMSLTDMILADPTELAKLKQALGIL